MSLYSMEEICRGCIHSHWHECCDSFCYCEKGAEDDVNCLDGICELKEVKE